MEALRGITRNPQLQLVGAWKHSTEGTDREEALLEANPFARFNSQIFKEQIYMLADAWGVTLDEVRTDQDLVVTDKDFEIICGKVAAGTVSGQRYHWQGMYNAEVIIEIDALWTIGERYPDHWPSPQDGWTITIKGSPSMQTHFLSCASFDPRGVASLEDHIHSADVAMATAAVNAIPGVCRAPAGVVTARDLAPALPFRPFGQS